MANVSARMRRIASDWEKIQKDFAGHKNIAVTPIGAEPPEKYHVTYYVNGIYLLPDGRIKTVQQHEVEITLHAEYPRYKPICRINTPIWHPNFRDGQICIGDIWGAGETLTDIIINIGDMIQYKSWNSSSPLSADAANWALENKNIFPVGNVDLHIADPTAFVSDTEIDLEENDADAENLLTAEEGDEFITEDMPDVAQPVAEGEVTEPAPVSAAASKIVKKEGNDFEITPEELEGITFIPSAQRMQSASQLTMAKGGKVNFKTILVKGLLWALIGSILGFGLSEVTSNSVLNNAKIAEMIGMDYLAEYYEIIDEEEKVAKELEVYYHDYCKKNDLDPDAESSVSKFAENGLTGEAEKIMERLVELDEESDEAFHNAYVYEMDSNSDKVSFIQDVILVIYTGAWDAIVALFLGLALGIGEGIYYGSKEKAIKYGIIGAGISVVLGFMSGSVAQIMYSLLLNNSTPDFLSSLIRAAAWGLMGIGIGLAVGFIRLDFKRILFCTIGGNVGAFIGGFIFNKICDVLTDDMFARAIGIVVMGCLIGLGVGLLEQFAKAAWLKVIRGEFEGKEYLVFAGTTAIGNNGRNNIVLFKDKLVAPHHCDIVMEGRKYVLVDQGSPLGTIVNGMRVNRHVLKKGDTIAVGNSVMVFNTK